MVESLLRICEEGPGPERFDSHPVLARWTEKWATQRRPSEAKWANSISF